MSVEIAMPVASKSCVRLMLRASLAFWRLAANCDLNSDRSMVKLCHEVGFTVKRNLWPPAKHLDTVGYNVT
jgi:hypothetical protein